MTSLTPHQQTSHVGTLPVFLVEQYIPTMPLPALAILTGSRHLDPLPAVLPVFLLAATVHDTSPTSLQAQGGNTSSSGATTVASTGARPTPQVGLFVPPKAVAVVVFVAVYGALLTIYFNIFERIDDYLLAG
jgi:hypothetical protein